MHTPRKSQTNEKNILFQFLCLPLSLKKCVHIWFEMSSVTSVEKRESRKHFSASACSFLGLGLRPRPQKCGLGFEKLSLGSLLSTSVTWEKLKSDVEKFYFRRDMEKNQNKILFLFWFSQLVSKLTLTEKIKTNNGWSEQIWWT